MSVELHGYQYSVYAWIARFALHEKGVAYRWVEVNPFADDLPATYLAMHPFGRVPTLVNGDFVLFETSAITRYVDEAFVDGPKFQPSTPEARARVSQIISIVDSYIYWPLVRQVFSHGVMGPLVGRPCDPSEYRRGLDVAPRILKVLGRLASGGPFLVGDTLTLADIHLAPMLSYFTEATDGFALFKQDEHLVVVDVGPDRIRRDEAKAAGALGVMSVCTTTVVSGRNVQASCRSASPCWMEVMTPSRH